MPDDPRPTITRREASRRVAAAGAAARDAAEAEACDPAARLAVADAAAGPPVVAGLAMHRVSLGAIWTLREAGSAFASGGGAGAAAGLDEVALAILVFHDPLAAYRLLRGHGPGALREQALELAFRLTPGQAAEAMGFINSEFERNAAAARPTEPPGKPAQARPPC